MSIRIFLYRFRYPLSFAGMEGKICLRHQMWFLRLEVSMSRISSQSIHKVHLIIKEQKHYSSINSAIKEHQFLLYFKMLFSTIHLINTKVYLMVFLLLKNILKIEQKIAILFWEIIRTNLHYSRAHFLSIDTWSQGPWSTQKESSMDFYFVSDSINIQLYKWVSMLNLAVGWFQNKSLRIENIQERIFVLILTGIRMRLRWSS